MSISVKIGHRQAIQQDLSVAMAQVTTAATGTTGTVVRCIILKIYRGEVNADRVLV